VRVTYAEKDGSNYCAGFPPESAMHLILIQANVATPDFNVTSTEGQLRLQSSSNKGSTKLHFMLVAIAVDYHLAPDEYKASR
jgi:hypothetical protein